MAPSLHSPHSVLEGLQRGLRISIPEDLDMSGYLTKHRKSLTISPQHSCLILWVFDTQISVCDSEYLQTHLFHLCFGEGKLLKATPENSACQSHLPTLTLTELTGKAGSVPHQSAHCRQTQLPDKHLLETWLAAKINLPRYLQRNHPSFSITSK